MWNENANVKVQFGNEDDGYKLVGIYGNYDAGVASCHRYLSENFPATKVYYWRGWLSPDDSDTQILDYGSHVNFFRIQRLPPKKWD